MGQRLVPTASAADDASNRVCRLRQAVEAASLSTAGRIPDDKTITVECMHSVRTLGGVGSLAVAGMMAVLALLSGCSLVSLKSPERPLSTRALNARIATRQFSVEFTTAVDQCADEIARNESDPVVLRNALRWKIAVTAQSLRAASQLAPTMAVLDTWTLSAAMQEFLSEQGAGNALLGRYQQAASMLANDFGAAAEHMARQVIEPRDFGQYQAFVADYVHAHPIKSLEFVRPSVVDLWMQQRGANVRLVDSLGTIPEALADTSDRVQMFSEALPSQVMWRTELALQDSGLSRDEIRAVWQKLDERSASLLTTANKAPQLVHEAVAETRGAVLDVLKRLDASSAATIGALRAERIALSATVSSERAVLIEAADKERKAIALDAADVASRVVNETGQQVRYLARETLLLLIVLAIVVLGLPFAAGYLVGRTRGRSKD